MGILQDIFNALQAFEITKIDGQPTDDDINKLTTQLTAALVTISTGNGGGQLGHIGIVVPESRYVVLSKGIRLDRPAHPGAYPATASDDKKAREKEVAEHKAEVIEFETYMACEAWARQAIVKAATKNGSLRGTTKTLATKPWSHWNSSIYFVTPVEIWTTLRSRTSIIRCWSRGTELKHL